MKNKNFRFNYLFVLLFYAILIFVVMLLWNYIVPDITGWKHINFWEALGLTVLLRLMCGNFHYLESGFHNHRHHHGRMRRMSREEREDFVRKRFQNLMKDEPEWEK